MTAPPRWTRPRLRVMRVLLNADAPLWAMDVATETGISFGTVYDTFRRLYDLGWAVGVTETKDHPGRPARVMYRPTKEGREQLAALLGEKD